MGLWKDEGRGSVSVTMQLSPMQGADRLVWQLVTTLLLTLINSGVPWGELQ